MPHNAILDVSFSDTQSSSGGLGGMSVFTYTAIGGEFGFQDDRLIDATLLLLFRDGPDYYEVPEDEDFNFINKQYKFNPDSGTITFPDNNPPVGKDPWPPLQPNEAVTMLIIAAGATILVTEPVTLAEAKAWLKVEQDSDDNIISMLITAARQYCEGYVGQSFVERTVTATLRNDLGGQRLPYGPVSNVISLKDNAGVDVAITSTTFTGIKFLMLNYCNGSGGEFSYKRNSDMLCATEQCNIFTLVYTAGYSVLPKHFKTAVLEEIAWLYQHRGDEVLAQTPLNPVVQMLLRPYKASA